MQPTDPSLMLASSSRYRIELLGRLQIPFTHSAPDIDEQPHPGEDARALTQRLARSKAQALSPQHPQHWILGSDQAAACNGRILGKPGTRERAIEQLRFLSGNTVIFHTAIALLRGTQCLEACDRTTVEFRVLSLADIERYVEREPAFDCAGSFKCEGYGISLFEALRSDDPTGLIGLPLIATRRLLTRVGFTL